MQSRVETVLQHLGLDADLPFASASGGRKRQTLLARALVRQPDVLLLDEPLGGMDPIARRKTIRLIKEWGRAGKSVIVSSHILHEIESMTANILLINQGRILAEGNVHTLYTLKSQICAAGPSRRVAAGRRQKSSSLSRLDGT